MIVPVDTKALVEIEKVENTTKGGIFLTDESIEKDQMLKTEGVMKSAGDCAFFELKQAGFDYPKEGEKVLFKKYSGILHSDGKDEEVYRLIQDNDIYAIERQDSTNRKDLVPVDKTVIIEIKKIEEKTEGGIFLTNSIVEKDQMLITEGIITAIGDYAFYDLKKVGFSHPKIGDKVFFKKYSGILHSDKETGKEYRLIQDSDIYALEKHEVTHG
jgi:co-chaperonin GroES (HSP10)